LLLLAVTASLAVPGCTNDPGPSQPVVVPPSQLNVLRLPTGHHPLVSDTVSFYAKVGSNRQASLFFQNDQGQRGSEFLQFQIRADGLANRPDGTPFQPGDSILITITASPDSVLFDFQPHGLTFNPMHPAELSIEYEECHEDFNDDGQSGTPADSTIQRQLAVWKQELLTDPFLKLQSVNFEDAEEMEAEVTGFTRFAIAY
jgi:hypothetical protein